MGRQEEIHEADLVSLAPEDESDVIWFSGPVDLEDSKLSDAFIKELLEWVRFFLSHTKTNLYVVDAESMPYFRNEGIRLATRLANEIGSRFVVEFDPDERLRSPRRFRAAGPAINAAAEAVFAERAAGNEEDRNGDWTIGLTH
ncbi:hypothetical protein AX769_17190 [Frondihabitans sp. PAMC 28766]|uniref:hypothetical protein n=1 Tax=Frondihabitans sp. PAMC 28766 TaxID=1795630 RepID=UPI00078EF7B5|nr:hypothetical protein [Frondihabitans sp. PAMC 28766]AMM21557.1 hypothetical protein AX769_17190 [Frondihabitans sp. PAMC 28766]